MQNTVAAANNMDPIGIAIALLITLAILLIIGYTIMRIGKKSGLTKHHWMAFVPLLQTFYMVMIADRPLWWFLLLLIPYVNIIIWIILCLDMTERCGLSKWMGLLFLVPLVNIIFFFYLGFSAHPDQRA